MSTVYGIALRNGEPAAGVGVELVAADGEVKASLETGSEGTFQFETEAGTWTVRWQTPEGPEEGEVQVPEGEDAEVEIELG